MAKFAANLTMLFTELDFIERFEAAHLAGFKAVEFLFPYAYESNVLAQKLTQYHLDLALFNMPAGNWEAGERGFAALPNKIQEFRASLDTALHYALALNAKKIHVMSGIVNPSYSYQEHKDTFIKNIQYAADFFALHNITLLIEPLNSRDVPNYFIAHQRDAVELIKQVDRSNVKLQLDLYHAQIMDGDLSTLIQEVAPFIGHVQIASVPTRNEPDQGEINYPYLFNHLDNIGFSDWIGCEYHPKTTTNEGLGWVTNYL